MKYVNSTLNVCYSNPFNYNEGPNSLSVYAQFIPDNPEEPDYGDFRVIVTLAKDNVEHSEVGWGNGKWGEECFADRIMRKIDEALYSIIEYELWIDPAVYLERESWLQEYAEEDFAPDKWEHHYDDGKSAVTLNTFPASSV